MIIFVNINKFQNFEKFNIQGFVNVLRYIKIKMIEYVVSNVI